MRDNRSHTIGQLTVLGVLWLIVHASTAAAGMVEVTVRGDKAASFSVTLHRNDSVVGERQCVLQRIGDEFTASESWLVPAGDGYYAVVLPSSPGWGIAQRTVRARVAWWQGRENPSVLGVLRFRHDTRAYEARSIVESGTWLGRPIPNPTNGVVEVKLGVEGTAPVDVAITDVAGRRVKTISDQPGGTGVWSVRWDGRDERGIPVPPGIYMLRLRSGAREIAEKIVVAR